MIYKITSTCYGPRYLPSTPVKPDNANSWKLISTSAVGEKDGKWITLIWTWEKVE